jgi:hypothetical protein
MKRITFLGVFLLVTSFGAMAQNKALPKSIISTTASVRKFYDVKELKPLQKGELIELYIERVKVLTKTLPFIALATKPGISMTDLGIPDTPENTKLLDLENESTATYIDTTVNFQRKMLPFCDKENIIKSILYFESTLKALKDYEQM